jgi:hypothetical protein
MLSSVAAFIISMWVIFTVFPKYYVPFFIMYLLFYSSTGYIWLITIIIADFAIPLASQYSAGCFLAAAIMSRSKYFYAVASVSIGLMIMLRPQGSFLFLVSLQVLVDTWLEKGLY